MKHRPLVSVEVPEPPDVVLERFRAELAEPAAPCSGHVGRAELSLRIADPNLHTWSPWLSLEVRPHEDGTLLRGRMGPQPELWTMFVFVYSAEVALGLGGAMYGFGQMMVGETPSGLWAAALALVGLGLSCAVDLTGRRVGRQQMAVLRDFVGHVVSVEPG